jgi:FxLD family lantipeptide
MTISSPTTSVDHAVNPFDLEVEIVPEAVTSAGRACTTNDGCAPSCASSCTSSSC